MGDKMSNSLICPNQLCSYGITIDECPQHLASPDHPSTHSIYCRDDDFRLPLTLNGVTLGFMTTTLTVQEIEMCRWIHLTNEHEWDPHLDAFALQESRFINLQDYQGYYPNDRNIATVNTKACANYDTVFAEISAALDDRMIATTSTSPKEHNTTAEQLARKWNVGLEIAKKTLKCTTQKVCVKPCIQLNGAFAPNRHNYSTNNYLADTDGSTRIPSSCHILPSMGVRWHNYILMIYHL